MMERNQPKAAVALFNKVLKQDSNNTSALFNKGLALNKMKKYTDAVTCFDKLLEVNPKDAKAMNNRGIAMAEMGDIQGENVHLPGIFVQRIYQGRDYENVMEIPVYADEDE